MNDRPPVISQLPSVRGTSFARFVIALVKGKGDVMQSLVIAENTPAWRDTSSVVNALKAVVAPGTTTDSDWAAPLTVSGIAREFVGLVAPKTVLGIIAPDARRVPAGTRIPRQTSSVLVGWTGEGTPKVAAALAFDEIILPRTKIAGLSVVTRELAWSSSPSAEQLLREDLAASIAKFTDQAFLDPTAAEVVGVSPASITNGTVPITGTGDIIADASAALAQMSAAGSELIAPYFIGDNGVVGAIAAAQGPLATSSLLGFPIIRSSSAPAATLVAIDAGEILFSDDAQLSVSVSDQATVDLGTGALTSLWQQNLLGVLVERGISWAPMHSADAASAYVTGVSTLRGVR